MPRTSLTQRQQWITRFHQSGLTQAAFARQHGLNPNTLHGWIRKEKATPQANLFLEIQPTPTLKLPCQIHLGPSLQLHLPDPTWLTSLLRHLAC